MLRSAHEGVLTPFDDLSVTAAFGRNRRDMNFQNKSAALRELMSVFCNFERGEKDGKSFVFGEVSGDHLASFPLLLL